MMVLEKTRRKDGSIVRYKKKMEKTLHFFTASFFLLFLIHLEREMIGL